MTLRLSFSAQAVLDMEEIVGGYANSDEAIDQTIRTFVRALEPLLEMPKLGAKRRIKNPRLKGLRHWVISDLGPFVVFYVPTREAIEVIRILHGARDIEEILKDQA